MLANHQHYAEHWVKQWRGNAFLKLKNEVKDDKPITVAVNHSTVVHALDPLHRAKWSAKVDYRTREWTKVTSECECVCVSLCRGCVVLTHPRWTGGVAADELSGASVTNHDCTCSPEGAHSVCLCVCMGVCVCIIVFLISSTTAIQTSWTMPLLLPTTPGSLSQSG